MVPTQCPCRSLASHSRSHLVHSPLACHSFSPRGLSAILPCLSGGPPRPQTRIYFGQSVTKVLGRKGLSSSTCHGWTLPAGVPAPQAPQAIWPDRSHSVSHLSQGKVTRKGRPVPLWACWGGLGCICPCPVMPSQVVPCLLPWAGCMGGREKQRWASCGMGPSSPSSQAGPPPRPSPPPSRLSMVQPSDCPRPLPPDCLLLF